MWPWTLVNIGAPAMKKGQGLRSSFLRHWPMGRELTFKGMTTHPHNFPGLFKNFQDFHLFLTSNQHALQVSQQKKKIFLIKVSLCHHDKIPVNICNKYIKKKRIFLCKHFLISETSFSPKRFCIYFCWIMAVNILWQG